MSVHRRVYYLTSGWHNGYSSASQLSSMSSDHSLLSPYLDKDQPLVSLFFPLVQLHFLRSSVIQLEPVTCTGTCKVKYRGDDDWDFFLDVSHRRKPTDLSLILPHYRARHQPVDHRMSMFVSTASTSPMRLKVVRPIRESLTETY